MSLLLLVVAGCVKWEQNGADLRVGDMITDFEVVMSDGSVVTDDELKENVSVVMFFHTSCMDCQQTLPVMQQIYDEYAPETVRIVLISREQGEESIYVYWMKNGRNNMTHTKRKESENHEVLNRGFVQKNAVVSIASARRIYV